MLLKLTCKFIIGTLENCGIMIAIKGTKRITTNIMWSNFGEIQNRIMKKILNIITSGLHSLISAANFFDSQYYSAGYMAN